MVTLGIMISYGLFFFSILRSKAWESATPMENSLEVMAKNVFFFRPITTSISVNSAVTTNDRANLIKHEEKFN